MAEACISTGVRNPAQACGSPDAQDMKDFLVDLTYVSADQATVMAKAWWTTGIQSKYIYPLPDMKSKESQDSGAVYESTPIYDQFISRGTISRMSMIPANTEMAKRLLSHSGNTGQFGIVTVKADGSVKMKINDDGEYCSHKLSVLNFENIIENDGSAGGSIPLKYTFKNPKSYLEDSVVFAPSFDALDLEALKDCVFTIISASATVITFTINRQADNSTLQSNKLVYGLTDASDLELLTTAGAAQVTGALTGGAISDSGVYTLTGTGYVTGTLGFIDPATPMTALGYDTYSVGTVTVA